jgi:hypothetical protein
MPQNVLPGKLLESKRDNEIRTGGNKESRSVTITVGM